MADILASEGVGKESSFHAEEHVDKRNMRLWEKFKEMATANDDGNDADQPLRQHECELMTPLASLHATPPHTWPTYLLGNVVGWSCD